MYREKMIRGQTSDDRAEAAYDISAAGSAEYMTYRNRRCYMRSRKGSSAVFLTVILAALISIAMALIYGVRNEALKSCTDAVMNLAGDSLLSEFDRRVQQEYGLFLIKGSDDELTDKLKRYVSYSLDDMKDIEISSMKASAARFSIYDPAPIRDQITEHMKITGAGELLTGSGGTSEGEGGKDETGEGASLNPMEARALRHGPTIASLPSADLPDSGLTQMAESLAGKVSSVDKAFEEGTDSFLINRYVVSRFNSRVNAVDTNHFFRSEIEYILGGENDDKKNEKRVEMALKAMRFPINMAHLYSDPEKRAALAAAAQAMTPGAAAVATQAALASTWAYAEADNDVELLWQGKKVPMVKDDSTWAIELDNAIEGVFGGTIEPPVEKGYDYSQYLQILLFFKDENIKLARILDLIQINMRAEYDGDFLIGEYAHGLNVRAKVNGRVYTYDKIY